MPSAPAPAQPSSSIPIVGIGAEGAAIRISPIQSEREVAESFHLVAEAFGRQARDAIWIGLNPGWDEGGQEVVVDGGAGGGGGGGDAAGGGGNESGGGIGRGSGGGGGGGGGGRSRARCIARLIDRWRARTYDRNGNPNTVFLKATTVSADSSPPIAGDSGGSGGGDASSSSSGGGSPAGEIIVGLAIWVQSSFVAGHGDPPTSTLSDTDLEALHPGDEPTQRFLAQCYRSLVRRRVDVVRAKERAFLAAATSSAAAAAAAAGTKGVVVDAYGGLPVAPTPNPSPSVMVLDLCAVHPAYQRRGIAAQLVRWGLEEARRRGGGDGDGGGGGGGGDSGVGSESGSGSGGGLEAVTEASVMGRSVYERLGFRPVAEIDYEVDEAFCARDRPSNLFMRTGNGAGAEAGAEAGTGVGAGNGAGAGQA